MNVTDEQVATDLKKAINAQLATLLTSTAALEADEHDGLNVQHVQFSLTRRPALQRRTDGRETRAAFRLLTRSVAATVGNVRELNRRVDLALLGVEVPVGGHLTTPIDRELQEPIAPDDGMFSSRSEWTFAV